MKEFTERVEKAIAEIRIKTGNNKPTVELLKETSKKYDVTVDELLNVGNWENYDYH